MPFMTSWCHGQQKFEGSDLMINRLGYTGEDGFEVSVPAHVATEFTQRLISMEDQDGLPNKMIGLGARDSLRLEAGLCLYGNDISEDVTPIEAMLAWTISKRRKEKGGFLGADTVQKQIAEGVTKKRCGFVVTEGRLPVREGAKLFTEADEQVGVVCSGIPAPSLENKGIGMAYVDVPHQKFKTQLFADQNGKIIPVKVVKMPFVPQKYYKP